MIDFKTYMDKINIDYEFLKKYYQSEDIASIYGVDKFEIRHSNVLKWILEPKGDEAIDYLPIRNLLKLIQEKNSYFEFFNSVDLTIARIDKVSIQREKYNIDMLITLKINNEDYAVVIENKLESSIHDNQLEVYRTKVKEIYPNHKKLYVFLYPGSNPEQEKEANDNVYIPITYQDVYDKILKVVNELSSNSILKLIVYYYIHTLCCYESNNLVGLVITDEEASALKSLFNNNQIITMIETLYSNTSNNEYTAYYNNNKSTFYKIFKKYLRMSDADSLLIPKIEKILKDKSYVLNGIPYKSISEVLKSMFDELLDTRGKTLDEIQDLVNIFSDSDPVLILKEDVLKTEHPKWYTSYPRLKEYKGNEYYILSSWYSAEYDEFKTRFKQLREDRPNVYESITLE